MFHVSQLKSRIDPHSVVIHSLLLHFHEPFTKRDPEDNTGQKNGLATVSQMEEFT